MLSIESSIPLRSLLLPMRRCQRGVGEPGGGVQDGSAGVRGCYCGAGQRERGLVQGPVSVILLSYVFLAAAVYDVRERDMCEIFSHIIMIATLEP